METKIVQNPTEFQGSDVPAFFINRFAVLVSPTVTRITFAEATAGTSAGFNRLAVAMTTEDASTLAALLAEVIVKNKEFHAAEEAKTEAPATGG